MSIPVPQDFNKVLYQTLAEADPEVQQIIDNETYRQFSGLELIASENLTSLATMQANGSILTNKYSEGLPGARYYGGNEYVDQLERLTQKRALEAFDLDPNVWGVNVQPYSGSTANFAAFTALIQPQDRVMGLGLPDGGHLTHGYYTAKKKITASSIYFQSLPYQVKKDTGYIDYELLRTNANLFKPRLLVCGGSAYPRDWDYKLLYEIAQSQGAYLLCDMAHVSGLVAAKELNNPFEYCDVVTTTTHKTLRGPRAGLIFFRKDRESDIEARVNAAVFPACQGGPHNNTIAGVAVALKQVIDPAFKQYAAQVRANAQALAKKLGSYNYHLQTEGTENHLILWDLRPIGLTGSKIEKICELAHITLNKNAVSGDTSAVVPGGIRIGTGALTSRSMYEKDMEVVGEFLHRAVEIAGVLQKEAGSKLLKDFVAKATTGDGEGRKLIEQLKADVKDFATKFPLPGVPDTSVIKAPAN
ncbi:glycine hydroxymethyltransferase [Malassezia cuniculi]|uniref:Serine hydroxymethyltransferase n=1 Tax=Malassezia cuniculi TaxID=948313 RepID=A0AAF0ERQ5_9BASI|nr:glycine hydroxymethyltransferase [Malassezia cuniculi]